MGDHSTSPYPGFDKSGQYYTPRRAPRIRPEASEFANKNSGSINLFSDEKHTHVIGPPPSPRCLSSEAKQNYEKSRKGQVSGLLGGGGPMPEAGSHPVARVKPEAQSIANHHKGGNMSDLITNNRGGPQSARQAPRVKVEASDNAEMGRGQRMSSLMHDPSGLPSTPRPAARIKSEAGETAELGSGIQMASVFQYGKTPATARPAPRVKAEAADNADLDQGKQMQNLFVNYGNQPQSARPAPRVRAGQDNADLDQGGRLSSLMHEGSKFQRDAKPPPRVTSSAGRRITKKGKQSSLSQVFSETSKWQIVPQAGVRNTKAY